TIGEMGMPGILLLSAVFAAGAASLWLNKKQLFSANPVAETAAKAVLLIGALLPLLCLYGQATLAALAANALLFVCAAGLMWQGAIGGSVRHVNMGVSLLVLMLATRFIDFLGSLLRSGAAFMGTGLLLAGLAYAINKGRKTLLEKASGGGAQ
ncbi:MAG TPA: hypothetical protein PLL10_10010, partial [Elusimicrobiales bacterium]|nr:hypothetical protein [Elusimicrobiales bacterium]